VIFIDIFAEAWLRSMSDNLKYFWKIKVLFFSQTRTILLK